MHEPSSFIDRIMMASLYSKLETHPLEGIETTEPYPF